MRVQSKDDSKKLIIEKNILDSYSVISFDVFDTLIKRDVLHPKDLFFYEERLLVNLFGKSFNGFGEKRIFAEEYIREKNESHECTLSEIYNEFFNENNIKENGELTAEKCASIEFELECKVCNKNRAIFDVYKYCKEKGKKIFFISDMYLSAENICTLLNNCGYDADVNDIYVSNEKGFNKRSGKLFQSFLEQEGLNASEVLHIGDSYHADFLGSRKARIKAIHVNRFVNNCIYPIASGKHDELSLDEKSLKAVINNASAFDSDRFEKIGTECFSPIVIGYVLWLRKKAHENGIKKLIFLARDSYLFFETYKKYFCAKEEDAPSIEYAYVSRKSLRLSYFLTIENFEDICLTFPTQPLTINSILEEIGFEEKDFSDVIKKYNISSEEKFNMREPVLNEKVSHVLKYIHENVPEKYYEISELTIEYLKQEGFSEENTAAVDIGWHGSLQLMLEKILVANGGNEIPFFYYGILSGAGRRLKGLSYYHYALGEENKTDEVSLVYFLERFVPEFIGSTKGYEIAKDGALIVPVLEEKDFSKFDIGKRIQKGCIFGVDEFFSTGLTVEEIRSEISYSALLSLIYYPKMEDAVSIGDIEFFDGIDYNMAKPKKMSAYIFHPGKLKDDIKKSRWREAFFYRLFKIRFPWGKMFVSVKKRYMKRKKYK